MSLPDNKPPILHILVVGFHHKRGCQVEFSFPPLVAGTTGQNECPSGWKYLPTLALPDGSHKYDEDTVFFNLPSLSDPTESVYGVSCYRQIDVSKLKIRTADVTRSTVQKSVCVLTRLPIYGYIEVKLSLIADAFFDQGDFSSTELLVKAYQQLNACLLDDESLHRPMNRHFYVGISLREISLHWRHKALILFKLFLLQRRVICFGSPVRTMCSLILGISSLIPRLLEKGFQEVACVRTSRPLSPMPDFTDSIQREADAIQQLQVERQLEMEAQLSSEMSTKISPDLTSCAEAVDEEEQEDCTLVSSAASAASNSATASDDTSPSMAETATIQASRELSRLNSTEESNSSESNDRRNERSNSLTRESSVDTLASTLGILSAVNPDEYRAPITIFASGNLCLPYLSLPYMDLLTDPSVLSYIIGTSNVLFQQKRQLSDVLVDIENANLDVHDGDLRRQLVLSTEDLRFMDYILKHVLAPKEDAEGSEVWIREQFQGYILALLRTAVNTDATAKDLDHFNSAFMQAFKRTQCFQEWYDVRPEPRYFDALPAGHPFAGTLSVTDMKLKIAQTMQNSESGRKINQAVNTTSRAVGGAISQAKGAFSNWWSSITTAPAVQATTLANITNVVGLTAGGDVSSSTISVQDEDSQEIPVTFQNNQEEVAASIQIKIPNNQKNVTLDITENAETIDNNDKLVDSAEEILELEDEERKIPQTLRETQPPADSMLLRKPQEGIVEIGKEAEILDKNTKVILTPIHVPTEAQEVHLEPEVARSSSSELDVTSTSENSRMERSNGKVFIV